MDSKATRKYEISRVTGQEAFTLADLEAFVRSCQKAGLAPTSQLLADSTGRRGEPSPSDLLILRAVESEAARKRFWENANDKVIYQNSEPSPFQVVAKREGWIEGAKVTLDGLPIDDDGYVDPTAVAPKSDTEA